MEKCKKCCQEFDVKDMQDHKYCKICYSERINTKELVDLSGIYILGMLLINWIHSFDHWFATFMSYLMTIAFFGVIIIVSMNKTTMYTKIAGVVASLTIFPLIYKLYGTIGLIIVGILVIFWLFALISGGNKSKRSKGDSWDTHLENISASFDE